MDICIVGAGGHSKSLFGTLIKIGLYPKYFCALSERPSWIPKDISYLSEKKLLEMAGDKLSLLNGIGSTNSLALRKSIFDRYKKSGLNFLTLIDPSSTIAPFVKLDEGVQVMAGAIIQSFCHISQNTIINTKSSIDHDCNIGPHCHIAPGATVCGNVKIGQQTHVGCGAVIIQGVSISNNCLVGAGSIILNNVRKNNKVLGLHKKNI